MSDQDSKTLQVLLMNHKLKLRTARWNKRRNEKASPEEIARLRTKVVSLRQKLNNLRNAEIEARIVPENGAVA
jgi:hypothetical protein